MDDGRDDENITAHTPSPAPVITVDYELYAHYLEDSDLTEKQKRELLQALWNIITEFVSLGFGVHPVQQAAKACGQDAEDDVQLPIALPNVIGCKEYYLSTNFDDAAEVDQAPAAERIPE